MKPIVYVFNTNHQVDTRFWGKYFKKKIPSIKSGAKVSTDSGETKQGKRFIWFPLLIEAFFPAIEAA